VADVLPETLLTAGDDPHDRRLATATTNRLELNAIDDER
jgi:hypothetical protein